MCKSDVQMSRISPRHRTVMCVPGVIANSSTTLAFSLVR